MEKLKFALGAGGEHPKAEWYCNSLPLIWNLAHELQLFNKKWFEVEQMSVMFGKSQVWASFRRPYAS